MNLISSFTERPGRKILILFSAALIISVIFLLNFCNNETTVKPERGPVVEAVYALGTVKTDKIYNARFGMNTIVRKLYVREGDNVEAGTPLVLGDTSYPLASPFSR